MRTFCGTKHRHLGKRRRQTSGHVGPNSKPNPAEAPILSASRTLSSPPESPPPSPSTAPASDHRTGGLLGSTRQAGDGRRARELAARSPNRLPPPPPQAPGLRLQLRPRLLERRVPGMEAGGGVEGREAVRTAPVLLLRRGRRGGGGEAGRRRGLGSRGPRGRAGVRAEPVGELLFVVLIGRGKVLRCISAYYSQMHTRSTF